MTVLYSLFEHQPSERAPIDAARVERQRAAINRLRADLSGLIGDERAVIAAARARIENCEASIASLDRREQLLGTPAEWSECL